MGPGSGVERCSRLHLQGAADVAQQEGLPCTHKIWMRSSLNHTKRVKGAEPKASIKESQGWGPGGDEGHGQVVPGSTAPPGSSSAPCH